MKKLICLFVASVMLVSCSEDNKDDNKEKPSDVTTFTKKIISYDTNGDSLVKDVKYNGAKIVSVSIGGKEREVFTYDGEQISKVVYLDSLGAVVSSKGYVYDGKKLVSCLMKMNGETVFNKVKYEYNTDGTISFSNFEVDVLTGAEGELLGEGKYTYQSGNLVKKEYSNEDIDQLESTVYEYDAKNGPFKNVLGLNLLLDNEELFSVNNLVKKSVIIGLSNNLDLRTFEYDYNANGYPVKKMKIFHDDVTPVKKTEFVY